jgi:hypothetical protein
MYNIEEIHVKTEELHFVEGNKEEIRYSKYIVYLDELMMKRSESSLHSILSRIRSDFKCHNEDIHWIGIEGINHVVIIKRWKDNTIGEYILPIKKSIVELNLTIMNYLYTGKTDISIFNELIMKVANAHSIIKKNKKVYKSKMYFYKLLVGSTDKSSLLKYKNLYGHNTVITYDDYVTLCEEICSKLDSLGRSLGDEIDN